MLRSAFSAMLKDPAFLADIRKAQMDFDHAPAERVQQIIADAAQAPEALRERARTIYRSTAQK